MSRINSRPHKLAAYEREILHLAGEGWNANQLAKRFDVTAPAMRVYLSERGDKRYKRSYQAYVRAGRVYHNKKVQADTNAWADNYAARLADIERMRIERHNDTHGELGGRLT